MKLENTTFKTPIHEITSLYSTDNQIFFKRDDLQPFSFGGNKVRIARKIIEHMYATGCDTLITYGNKRSNLCRVTTNMCAALGIKCYMISITDDDHGLKKAFNGEMAHLFGAQVIQCEKSEVDATVAKVKEKIVKEGGVPYYINEGDAVINQASTYVDVYNEIMEQSKEFGGFDYIFCASGSGTTQAGLTIGKLLNSDTAEAPKVVGISIARVKERGLLKLNEHINGYFAKNNITNIPAERISEEINLATEYLCGGYSLHTDEIRNACTQMLAVNGIELDTTYTGKAYVGCEKYLKDNNIKGKKVLFVHTGGLPLFFDLMNEF
ncbi:MAG: pyridoxal-phosphate dependent enzyme [Ruminococcaceae bacterium]|nr:pyridoxal-phosphate dependent enzyme [Oscillospiraceae bacterium]